MRSIYVILVLSLLWPTFLWAQSGQYKRAQPKTEEKAKDKATSDGKVDIKELEEQYWTPQDTEFKVVQNRKYSKSGRLGVSLQFGLQTNDPYSDNFANLNATMSYYWSEFMGVELTYSAYDSKETELIERFKGQFGGTTPEFAVLEDYIGVNFNWVPIYGKMSILDSNIIYFDLAISPGLGYVSYTPQVKDNVADTEKALALSLDVSQHFFFHEHWAIRLDMKNRAYQEERFNFSDATSKGKTDRIVTLWQLGFTYYFDAPSMFQSKKKKEEKKADKKD